MALLDVTELLLDPDFVDPIAIIHRKPYINSLGENLLSESRVATIGSVQPASGKEIRRLPESLQVGDVSSFWVKGLITADGTCAYPDLLEFKGQRYQVQTINDWMNFGQGWCEGTCIRQRIAL